MTTSEHVRQCAQTLWDYHCVFDSLQSVDVIVGLGSYDCRVADRCAELYFQGVAPHLLFTGAAGNWTAGLYESSEADAFAKRAMAIGVCADVIMLEERATNIGENVRFSAMMIQRHLSPTARAIFVTKPQTQRRCFATLKQQWRLGLTLVTAPLFDLDQQITDSTNTSKFLSLTHLINEMVGDLHRIDTYPDAGFQIPQQIPQAVWDAYQTLVEAGYTEHL